MLTQAELVVSSHGTGRLTDVHIDIHNVELRDEAGFIGDRASVLAFRAILDDVRERVSQADEDMVGDVPSKNIRKKKLDRLLLNGDLKAARVVIGTVEELAQEFATVIGRFLRLNGWRGTQQIVVGAGLWASRIGELAIGRMSVFLKGLGLEVQLTPIRHDPNEAGLVGCIHLVPS